MNHNKAKGLRILARWFFDGKPINWVVKLDEPYLLGKLTGVGIAVILQGRKYTFIPFNEDFVLRIDGLSAYCFPGNKHVVMSENGKCIKSFTM